MNAGRNHWRSAFICVYLWFLLLRVRCAFSGFFDILRVEAAGGGGAEGGIHVTALSRNFEQGVEQVVGVGVFDVADGLVDDLGRFVGVFGAAAAFLAKAQPPPAVL